MVRKMRSISSEIRVAVVANFALAYNRKILLGAATAAAALPRVRLYHCDHFQAQAVINSRHPEFDRVLLGASEPRLQLPALFARQSIRTVDTSGEMYPPLLPRVISDDLAVGRRAAEYLLERGFSRYLFFGYKDFHWSNLRLAGYRSALAGRGHLTKVLLTADVAAWDVSAIAEKLFDSIAGSSGTPVAVFCANDSCAAMLVEACVHAGLRIPEQAAILGVDDDEMYTQLRHPNISSIQLQCRRIGYEAMQWLLADAPPAPPSTAAVRTLLIPPQTVVSRQSTDIVAVDDPLLRLAAAYIRDHLHEGVNIKLLTSALGVSRTTLETRFKRILGRLPGEEVRRQRLARACEMLSSGNMAVGDIARRVGFSSAQLFSESFRRYKKMTPLAYRESMRLDVATSP